MNKYTLKFKIQSNEDAYQSQLEPSYKIVFILLSSGTFLLILLNIFINYVTKGIVPDLYIRTPILCYLIIQVFIVRKYLSLAKYGILITNILFMLFQLNPVDKEDQQFYYAGQNFMSIHDMTMLLLDFQLGAVNNILIFCVRTILLEINTETSYYFGIIMGFIVQSLMMLCLYMKCQYQRQYFLLSKQDKYWEIMMPQVMTKPLFVFSFDQEKIKFIHKRSVLQGFLSGIQDPLLYFIRESKYLNQTLENFIFSIKDTLPEVSQFKVKFLGITKQVRLQYIDLDDRNFLMIIDDEDVYYKLYKTNLLELLQQQSNLNRKVMFKLSNVLKNVIQTQNIELLINLRCEYVEMLLYHQQQILIEKINVWNLIKKVISSMKGQRKRFRFENSKQKIEVFTLKYYFIILILDLFKRTKKFITISLMMNTNEQLELLIEGELTNCASSVFDKIASLMIQTYRQYQGKTYIIFHDTPIQAFRTL